MFVYSRSLGDAYFSVVFDDRQRIWASAFSLKSEEEAKSTSLRGVEEPVVEPPREGKKFAMSVLRTMRTIFNGGEVDKGFELYFDRLSDFSRKVLEVTAGIPKGKVLTYGAIGRMLKTSPRAVGGALSRNPFVLLVPCHRVVKSDGSLGGYSILGQEVKRGILDREFGKPYSLCK